MPLESLVNPALEPSSADATRRLILSAGERPATEPPTERDPWIGRRLREFVIERFLGAGGVGRVYLARHEWLEMPVAVKILNETASADEQCVARFRREALAVAKLNHSHIVRAVGGGVEGGTLFLATEFIVGENVATIVQRHGRLTVADACAIVCQAAAALQHAHEHGLVHRDIKPSNLMLTNDGTVKLLDLGLARFTHGAATLTETGHILGTLDFMAPEQVGDTRDVDIRSDIYSLGCTLYCLLTGAPPYAGPGYETPISKMIAHVEREPRPVQECRRNIPPAVARCLAAMTAKDRELRFQTPAEVAEALGPFAATARLDCLNQSSADASRSAPTPPRTIAPRRETPDWLIALGDAWAMLYRTTLCLLGILEKRTAPSSLRPGAPLKTSYEISAKGIVGCLIVLLFLALAFVFGVHDLFREFAR